MWLFLRINPPLHANWKHRRITHTTGNETKKATTWSGERHAALLFPRSAVRPWELQRSAFISELQHDNTSRSPDRDIRQWYHRYAQSRLRGQRDARKAKKKSWEGNKIETWKKKPWSGRQPSARYTCNWVSHHAFRNWHSTARPEQLRWAPGVSASSALLPVPCLSLHLPESTPYTEEPDRRNRQGKSRSGSVRRRRKKKAPKPFSQK